MGLLSFYYPPSMQDKLMGYSSAMNQMGGVIATLLSGVLAAVSWRASFLVYLMGIISFVLCFIFLPNDRLIQSKDHVKKGAHPFRRYYPYIISMFLLMITFFIYPANFVIETASDGIIPQNAVAVIMAFMDFIAFAGGLLYIKIKDVFNEKTPFVSPVIFMLGYFILALFPGWIGAVIGSAFIGFANGGGVPCIIAGASQKAGKEAVSSAMPLISAALYLGQFATPFIMSGVSSCLGGFIGGHLSYYFAAAVSVMLLIWTWLTAGKCSSNK